MTAPVLVAAIAATAVAAAVSLPLMPGPRRAALAAAWTVTVGVLTCSLGAVTLNQGFRSIRVGWLIPLAGAEFGGDTTSGLFAVIAGAITIVAGLYTAGYARSASDDEHAVLPATAVAMLPFFVAAMALVPFATSVTTFLVLWEAMAAASLVLVLAEHRESQTRDAGLVYAVMTHLGFVAIVVALVILAAGAGGEDFATIAGAHLTGGARAAVFVLTVIGFGSKAGLVPLHAWLPKAHSAAPSPVSALMSTAMVNLGVYGLLRFDVQLLGSGPSWWGLTLIAAGGVTAIYGALQACVATDLKRLLAYSTSENMGLVALAIGAALLLSATGNHSLGQVALVAALLHVINHAAFKTLGFLAAGSVVRGTGVRDLDQLGGLARRMPATSMLFGVSALGAAGLPLGAGFVSEWLLLQSLIHPLPTSGTVVAFTMPLAVGAVALTAGLGVTAMVKAFGIGFLARPRSAGASNAREASPIMLVAMGLGAVACAVLAVAPAVAAPLLRIQIDPAHNPGPALGWWLRLPGVGGSIAPSLLAVSFVLAMLVALGLVAMRAARARQVPLWACGGGQLTPRMQYTATSFAEPLQRVFDDVLRPDVDVDITHTAESRYLLEKVRYHNRIGDTVEARLYEPVVRALTGWANLVRRAHVGSVHVYLGFGAFGLLVALVIAR